MKLEATNEKQWTEQQRECLANVARWGMRVKARIERERAAQEQPQYREGRQTHHGIAAVGSGVEGNMPCAQRNGE